MVISDLEWEIAQANGMSATRFEREKRAKTDRFRTMMEHAIDCAENHDGVIDKENIRPWYAMTETDEKSRKIDEVEYDSWQGEDRKKKRQEAVKNRLTEDDILKEFKKEEQRAEERYKECLEDIERQKKQIMNCPECGGNLVDREGPYGGFVACSNYPSCTYSRTFWKKSEEKF